MGEKVTANDQKSKPGVISATTLQRQIGSVIRRVARSGEHIVIENNGYPVAVLVPVEDYDRAIGKQGRKA